MLHLKTAAEFDHRIENALHDVRINQVPLRLHCFGEGHRGCCVGLRRHIRLSVRQKHRQAHVEHLFNVHFARS